MGKEIKIYVTSVAHCDLGTIRSSSDYRAVDKCTARLKRQPKGSWVRSSIKTHPLARTRRQKKRAGFGLGFECVLSTLMAKPRKPKNEDPKPENAGAVVHHQKLCKHRRRRCSAMRILMLAR